MPSIESALGVVNCYEIASSSKRIDALVFGIFDLLNDMGIEYTKGNPRGAKYSRYKVPVAATAAGVAAIDGICQDLQDNSGFVKYCQIGRSLGYAGKSVIHPDQIKTVHKIFHPSKPEIAWAKKVCSVYEKSTKKGKGATVVDGKMIDEVHYKRARALLERSEEHTSELQSLVNLVCRLLLEKKKPILTTHKHTIKTIAKSHHSRI